jgi:peroxiredoxin
VLHSRRLRKQLKLPFTVLSDSKLEVARSFGLIGHERPGEPTPATSILDGSHGVILSTLNE